jgi:hypothetical protein
MDSPSMIRELEEQRSLLEEQRCLAEQHEVEIHRLERRVEMLLRHSSQLQDQLDAAIKTAAAHRHGASKGNGHRAARQFSGDTRDQPVAVVTDRHRRPT